ncbi:RAMP superfamily protein [bacterium BMS3Abin06]|nr:RAMP superfamily protein [bacterium BMS3Abin06]
MPEGKIKGRILLCGQVQCLSPLRIGCGSSDRSDIDILLDTNRQPFIPATSFVGVLRHSIKSMLPGNSGDNKKFKEFWGYMEEKEGQHEGQQSSLRCSDLYCVTPSPEMVIRDGIKIDHKTNIVKDQGKYDYELVERGAVFDLKMEFSYKETDESFVRQMVATIFSMLERGNIHIGAGSNSGFGEIELVKDRTKIYNFNFSKKENVSRWLNYLNSRKLSEDSVMPAELYGKPLEINNNEFCIDATFRLKNSFIIRAYSDDPKMPDSTHIKSLNDWIMTGTSLKGAVRARAERIVNTLALEKAETIVNGVFGYVDEKSHSGKSKKGRVRVSEVILPKFVSERQTRIKIDRFTGGTIESALFDSMPLFTDFQDKTLHIQINIKNCKPYEAGLLLLVLKDLWTGDIAIGGEKNVGRGVFEGEKAIIKYNTDEPIIIEKDLNNLLTDEKEKLQGYVDALVSEN